jgi:predicted nucleic acid-binding protein
MTKKVFIDTSILVPAFAESHPNHKECFSLLEKTLNKKIELIISSHVLLEFYSVYSRLPLITRLSTLEIKKIIEENIYPYFKMITISEKEYKEVIQHISNLGLSGGIVYDFFHYMTAHKAMVSAIITYNEKDFQKININKIPIVLPGNFRV